MEESSVETLRRRAQKIGSFGTLIFFIGLIFASMFFLGKGWFLSLGLFQQGSLDIYTTVGIVIVLIMGIGASFWVWSQNLYSIVQKAEIEFLEATLLDDEQGDPEVSP